MCSQGVSQALGVGRGCLDKEQTELQPDTHLNISLKKPLKRSSYSEILSHLHSSPSLRYLRWLVSPPPQSFFPFSCSFFLISAVSASALSFPSADSPTRKQSFTAAEGKRLILAWVLPHVVPAARKTHLSSLPPSCEGECPAFPHSGSLPLKRLH